MVKKAISRISLIKDRTLMKRNLAKTNGEFRFRNGTHLKLKFRRGRIVAADAIDRRGRPLRVFSLKTQTSHPLKRIPRRPMALEASFEGGEITCYVCVDNYEKGVCECRRCPCACSSFPG